MSDKTRPTVTYEPAGGPAGKGEGPADEPLKKVVEDYNDGTVGNTDAAGLAEIGRAAFLLRSPKDANQAFNESEKADKKRPETLFWRADLFLDRDAVRDRRRHRFVEQRGLDAEKFRRFGNGVAHAHPAMALLPRAAHDLAQTGEEAERQIEALGPSLGVVPDAGSLGLRAASPDR